MKSWLFDYNFNTILTIFFSRQTILLLFIFILQRYIIEVLLGINLMI